MLYFQSQLHWKPKIMFPASLRLGCRHMTWVCQSDVPMWCWLQGRGNFMNSTFWLGKQPTSFIWAATVAEGLGLRHLGSVSWGLHPVGSTDIQRGWHLLWPQILSWLPRPMPDSLARLLISFYKFLLKLDWLVGWGIGVWEVLIIKNLDASRNKELKLLKLVTHDA